MIKDIARALSLANLCFIAVWVGLLDTTHNIPGFSQYLAVIIDVSSLALLFWIAVALARRSSNPAAWRVVQLVFPLALLVPLNGVIRLLLPPQVAILDRTQLPVQAPVIEFIIIALGILMISVSDIPPWNRVIVRAAAAMTLVLFPFFLITMVQATRSLRFSDKGRAPLLNAGDTAGPRVLWLVFDEMDYGVAFSRRPPTLQLPEFDRLRSQSFFASNALPPADHTLISMPALITGRPVKKAEPVSPSKIMITFADSNEPVTWSSQPNLFSRAREFGFNTAVIGWYLPYCGVIGESLTDCSWQESEPASLGASMLSQTETLVETIPLVSTLAYRFGLKQRQQRERQLEAVKIALFAT